MINFWVNYIIFNDKNKTYVGSTININRRIKQHNSIIKGGAKYTKGSLWHYYCIIFTFNMNKCKYLSREWHLKYVSKKNNLSGRNGRKKTIEKYFNYYIKNNKFKKLKKYKSIIFISKKYIHLTPILNPNIFIIYLDILNYNTVLTYIKIIKMLHNQKHH